MQTHDPITILVIDPNEILRAVLRDCIEFLRPGWRVLEASTGVEAIQVAQSAPPDLVFLDDPLPDLTGYALVTILRAMPEMAKSKFILTTYMESNHPATHPLRQLCTHVLFRPFEFGALKRLLHEIEPMLSAHP